jgi:hypothetical protein
MIIDGHIHVRLSEDPQGAIDELVARMHRAGVGRACLMPGGGQNPLYRPVEQIRRIAKELVTATERYPGVFYPMLWLNPTLPAKALQEIVEEFILGGPICGVKLSIQMNARDPRLEPLAALMEERDVPVLFHSWYKTVQKYRFESDPSDIAVLAGKFPKLRILMAHITGCRFRGVQDIRPHENVLLDTCGSQPEDGYLAYGLEHLGAERVVFGSDHPGRDIAVQLGRVQSVVMEQKAADNVLRRNAERFFGDAHA